MTRLVTFSCDNPACTNYAAADDVPDGWLTAFVALETPGVTFWQSRGCVGPWPDGYLIACSPKCMEAAVAQHMRTL